MKRICLLLAVMMLFVNLICLAEDDEWIVEEVQENRAPDPVNQARILMRWMTDEEKIGQMLMVAPEDLTGEKLSQRITDADAFTALPAGGVILYGQNIASHEQLPALTGDIYKGAQNAGLYTPFVAVDEEGGYVARIANKLGLEGAETAEEIGLSGNPEDAYQAGLHIGGYLKEYGVNLNLAPVADVLISDAPELDGRSYGKDAQLVSLMSGRMADGLREQGIIPCFKHFPGHGTVTRNAHNVPVQHGRTYEQMVNNELIPFQDAIDNGAEMIMLSHLRATALDQEYPASLSHLIVEGLLREEMGYNGVVITDALRMDAIREEYSVREAVVLAVNAGADILLVPGDGKAAFQALKDAVEKGEISMERIEDSVARIIALKIKSGLIK